MQTSHKNTRLPSKTQYISQTNGFVPSNLYKQANNTGDSFTTTARQTFNQNMNLNETQRNESFKASSLGNTIKPSQSKSLKNKPKQKNKRKPAAKTIGQAEIEYKRSLLSGGSSVSGVSSPKNFKRAFEGEEEPVKRSQPKRSASEQKQSLPGNYTAPEILYKGVFQNNYMMGDTIEVSKNNYYEIPVRKDYRYFEEQYSQKVKEDNTNNTGFRSSSTDLENKLREYGLAAGNENIEPNPMPRRYISISDNINNSHNHFNQSFVPDSFNFEKIPGYVANRKTRTEKEKSILKIQGLVRGMIARKRIRNMKERLTRHFNGDLEVSPYEIEFFDLNVPVFQQILGIKAENKTMTAAKGSSVDDDPKKKLLSNTFYSVLRSGFFPEDPMDYVVLAELQDYEDATFPKLLKEQAEKNSKEVMLAKKYEYLFGKPSVDRELKTDNNSVIKNFLKTNLASITASDLKVTKFQTDYKSIIKPKVKQDQPTYISPSPFKNNYTSSAAKASSPVADTNKFKKFDSFATKNVEKSIQSEISEDYSNDFEEDSAIKESISGIRESIRYSMDESRIRESIRESIIKESIDYSSPPKKLKNRFSNKSISEDIVESYGGMGKNSSVKSIQEDIPLSESIVASRVNQKRKPSVDDDIEEDIDIKDSYGNEEFESLEESIQESIEKFQAMRKSPSPDKKEKKPAAASPRRSPEEKFSTAKPMFKKSASKDEEVSPIIPKPQSFLGQKSSTSKPVVAAEPLMTSEKKETNKNFYKFSEVIPEEPTGYEEYRREERKNYLLDENLLNIPKSNTAEILFTNFQKELEKMLYMDSLTQKVGALENTIDKLYNQKEFNLLNTLQNRASSSAGFKPTESIRSVPGGAPESDNNFMVYLMQKNNALERSMAALSKQMNFLINNFTGAQGTAGGVNTQTTTVSGAKAQRKPRPIIPVRKAQSLRPKTADVKKESTSPAPRVQPAAAVVVQKEVNKQEKSPKRETIQVPTPVVQTKAQPIKEPVKELVKEVVKQPIQETVKPQPAVQPQPEKKPKFAFKFASESKNTQAAEDEEKETITLPTIKKEPEPVIKTPTPAVVQPPVSTYKSAKFGKWQQESSSEGAVEEEIIENLSEQSLPKKKEKSSEEEVDFSAKDYSESFEKLSPLASPKKTIISKFEDKKILTPKQDDVSKYSESFEELTPTSTAKKPSPQKFQFNKQPSPKHKSEEDIDELIIDEDIDLPSDTKEEPPVVTKPVFKKPEPAQLTLPFTQTQTAAPVKKPEPEFEEIADDDEYGEEDFEELSLPSEKEDDTPVKVTPKADNKFIKPQEEEQEEEVQPKEERSWSEDLEASQDMSVISWQGAVWTAQEAARNELKALEEKEKKMKEEKKKLEDEKKKVEEANKPVVEEKKADKLEDVKAKAKHAIIAEQHSFDVHQDVVDQVMASPKQEEKIEKAEEEEHHLKHFRKVEEDVKVIIAKMNQAPKHQLIHIVMNHINFSDPNDPKAKLSIFDKSPVQDESIVDAYNEIFLNLFRSEFRKLNTDFATTPRVQAKMEIKIAGLIARSQEILLKRIRKTTTTPEFYTTMGKNFNNIYDTLRNKKLEGEENDFYEEEEDIKRLMEEENNKLKETIADQVMESLFEETVKDLIRIAQNRKKL